MTVGTGNEAIREAWLEQALELARLPEMGTRYGARRSRSPQSLALRAASAVLRRVLQGFADRDTGSDELLYYGTHVVAIKKED